MLPNVLLAQFAREDGQQYQVNQRLLLLEILLKCSSAKLQQHGCAKLLQLEEVLVESGLLLDGLES